MSWRRSLLGVSAAIILGGCGFATRQSLPDDLASAAWLAPGPHRVATTPIVFVDGARDRTLASTLWWPAGVAGPAPLLVQVHGFLQHRNGAAYLARHLASRGWVVVAASHPHTTMFARGGARLDDVVQQPGDVRFLIDRLLAGVHSVPALPAIDPARIAVMGFSLGGLTAALAAFHPRARDPRIAAAISIAGPLAMLRSEFFRGADVPLLMIAGSADVIVDYERNAAATLDRVPGATLVSIADGSHAGFHEATAWVPRVAGNPDVVGCWALRRALRLDTARARVRDSVRGADGIDVDGVRPPCLDEPPAETMPPARQQMLTTVAVTAFLASRFAPEPAARTAARDFLSTTFPRELPAVQVRASRAR